MGDRREFMRQISAAALMAGLPEMLFAQEKAKNDKIWACLLHLSFNMWEEYISPHRPFRGFRPSLQLSEALWNDAVVKMAQAGINMVVIDLGDAVAYESHPEIAVQKAWSASRLRKELDKICKLGLEPIPKMNFSAGHDTWLGEYSKMVSTKKYYEVCAELITEVFDLFGNPRFFHLGMDEESADHQRHYNYVVVRQNDSWWKDFYYLVGIVEKQNSRAWIWPDYMLWHHPEQFFKKMPKSVVQSNWYYGENFGNESHTAIKAYLDLETHGYDQIPTGSFHNNNGKSIGSTVRFCSEHVDDSRLLGFLQTFWKPTIEENRELITGGIELMGEVKALTNKTSVINR